MSGRSGGAQFAFARLPKRSYAALRSGEIDEWDVCFLGYLYGLLPGKHATTVRISIPTAVEGIAWPWTHDALYRRLLKLHDLGWLRYEVRAGSHAPVYTVELWPGCGSEDDPRWKLPPRKRSASIRKTVRPSTEASDPRSGRAQSRVFKPEPGGAGIGVIRAAKSAQESACLERGLNNNQRLGTKSGSISENEEPTTTEGDAASPDGRLFDDDAYGRRLGYGQEPGE